jgi:AbrB family looped-hinge helix DNA binding protein
MAWFERKLFKIDDSLAVRIPKTIADKAGLDDGDEVKFSAADGKIIIEKAG